MEFRILGPLEVVGDAGPIALPRGRGRALLGILVLHAAEVLSTDRLIDELWGDARPPTAVTALHGLVSTLRRRLEPRRASGERARLLRTHAHGYVLAVDRAAVDANRFSYLVEQAGGAPAEERAAQLRAALALWRGPPLAEFTYEPFAQTAIAALEELRLTALDQRIEADLALGRHGELVAELEALCADHPLRERLRGHLMVALYRCGRQADGLAVYRGARAALLDELGIEPGPALRDLEKAILRHDPSLDAPQRRDRASSRSDRSWLPQGRRTATTIFVDLGVPGSADRWADPEAVRGIVRRGYDVVAEAVDRHGGTVEAFIADVVVAVFGVPVAHEDDALRAVRAALDVHQRVAELNDKLGRDVGASLVARTGIATGEVVVSDPASGQPSASGSPVKLAARLQQAAGDDEVLVSETTRLLVEDAAVLEPVQSPLLDRSPAAVGWKLRDIAERRRSVTDPETPLVGREHELSRLRATFDAAVRTRRAQRCTVVGDAGIGKSRLGGELARAVGDRTRVLTGRCRAYGEGITFWPLREIVLEVAGDGGPEAVKDLLADDEAAAMHILSAIGLAEHGGNADEVFPAVRRFLEVLARKRPLVLVLDDVHWAQPTLLDLVEYLTGSTRASVLLLCLARPELLQTRPTWAEDRQCLVLDALDRDDSAKLVAARTAHRVLPPETLTAILDTAQGNPFFIEQLLAALRTDRTLSIPPSVYALLAARLDRLGPAERDLLRCASVVGSEFSTAALTALIPDEARPFVARHLHTLERHELIGPARRARPREPAFDFRHILIQQAAYRSITRQGRAELHEQFADWHATQAGPETPELAAVVGHHLEQAWDQRRRAGLADDATPALADRAGEQLAHAGAHAYARYDMAATANLLSRATSLLAPHHPQRPALLRQLSAAYQQTGRLHDADVVLGQLLGDPCHDERAACAIRLERSRLRLFTGPDPTPLATLQQEAELALEVPDASADEVAQACHVLALVHLRAGRIAAMQQIARRGLAHADRSGNPRDELAARWNLAWVVHAGPIPVVDGIRLCEELVRWRGREHPGLLCELGRLRAMNGQLDEARELTHRGRRLLQEWMQARGPLLFGIRAIATVETLGDDDAAAGRHLRVGLEIAQEMGTREQTAELAALLSRILSRQGAIAEAKQLAAASMEQAPAESVTTQALSRAAMARALAAGGRHEQAAKLARTAAALPPADMLSLRADLLIDLADVHHAAGALDAAHAAVMQAIDLCERKGNRVAAARARSSPCARPTATTTHRDEGVWRTDGSGSAVKA